MNLQERSDTSRVMAPRKCGSIHYHNPVEKAPFSFLSISLIFFKLTDFVTRIPFFSNHTWYQKVIDKICWSHTLKSKLKENNLLNHLNVFSK